VNMPLEISGAHIASRVIAPLLPFLSLSAWRSPRQGHSRSNSHIKPKTSKTSLSSGGRGSEGGGEGGSSYSSPLCRSLFSQTTHLLCRHASSQLSRQTSARSHFLRCVRILASASRAARHTSPPRASGTTAAHMSAPHAVRSSWLCVAHSACSISTLYHCIAWHSAEK